MISKTLDLIYSKAINGMIGLDSAYELAEDYKQQYPNDLYKQISSLVKWQCAKSAASGFSTNLGGILTLPIALPANITSVLFVQVRMIAAIAILCGYNPKQDKVKTLIYCCLIMDSIKNLTKEIGIKISTKFGYKTVNKIPYKIIKKINEIIGFKLLTKSGEKGIINLTKIVPFLGGVVAGGFDAFATMKIGNFAENTFVSKDAESFIYSAD